MRISTTQIFQSGVSAMQRAQSELNHTSLQMATGRRILTPSDDPGGATQSVQLNSAIKATEQFQRNGDYAQPRLEQEEAGLVALGNYLQRARELVVTGNNDSYNQENRNYLASEIRQLREDILGISNTRDANGEYLFAGTRSQTMPFVVGDDGRISYVGAEGEGAVREVAITNTQRIASGDTGSHVFMAIPEKSGLLTEAVPGSANSVTSTLKVKSVEVADLDDSLNSAGETFRIRFKFPPETSAIPLNRSGSVEYQIVDLDGNSVQDSNGNYLGGVYGTADAAGNFVPPTPVDKPTEIELAGRRVTLTGDPSAPADLATSPYSNDEIISRPVKEVSLFKTLDDIATALETPVTDTDTRAALSEAASMALRNIDSSLERTNEVRTSVGLRLNTLETQTDLNDERLVALQSTLSDVSDLDYAEAISRFKQQEVVLQAAQQTYAQVTRLSLFDFI